MRPRSVVSVVVAFLLACSDPPLGPGPASPPAGQDSLALHLVAQGLSQPVYVTAPPADSTRLFVVEQGGRVRIIRRDTLTSETFLDLRGRVSTGSEQGLLSLAFHPQYAANGYAFASYTNPQGHTRIVRYRVSADPDSLDAASGDTILAVAQPYGNHNGGLVAFGPGGYLYVGLGDGGSGGDPQNHGQNLGTLLGSLLRLDVNGSLPYAIPATNPFVGHATARPEIWASGLRNPWRFAFDRATHDLYLADVGQGTREEVNVQLAASAGGENYGWRLMEGSTCFGSGGCSAAGLVLPVVEYVNGDGGCAVTGGYVYRGAALPAFAGTYFYADYCQGWIRSFRYLGGQLQDHWDWSGRLAPLGPIASFGEDARGDLYVVAHNGRVWRIVRRS